MRSTRTESASSGGCGDRLASARSLTVLTMAFLVSPAWVSSAALGRTLCDREKPTVKVPVPPRLVCSIGLTTQTALRLSLRYLQDFA